MKILVTGGLGFIGTNFLDLFVSRFSGHEFLNFDAVTYAANERWAKQECPNYHFVRGDIGDADGVKRVVADWRPELIVHLAAETHVDRSISAPRPFLRSNVDGTVNLLEAAKHVGARFHHVSTDEVYGSLGEHGYFTERSRYEPSSPYSASKASSDHFVRAYHRTFDLPVTITNCSNNYGPYQHPEKLIPLMISRAIEGKPLPIYGDGGNVRDWLYVLDHCEAIWRVAMNGTPGETYLVGGGAERKNVDVVDVICETVASARGIDKAELLKLKTPVPDRPGHDRRYAIDHWKISSELGWKPNEGFESGIRKTVLWYLANSDWLHGIVRSTEFSEWTKGNYENRG